MILPYKGIELQRKSWMIGCGAIALIGLAFVLCGFGGLEEASFDLPFHFRKPLTDTNVVLVLEDRAALDELGQPAWPPDRTVHARLVDKLREQGAAMIVFDIMFRADKPEDKEFAAAIKRHGKVVLGGLAETSGTQMNDHPGAVIAEIRPPATLLQREAAGWGLLVTGDLDPRFTVRRMITSIGGTETMPWVAAKLSGKLPVEEKASSTRWINFYGPTPAFSFVTLSEALELRGRKTGPGFFKGKTVFVGAERSIIPANRDVFRTPYSDINYADASASFTPGVELHANVFVNLINGNWLRRLPSWLECAFVLLFGAGVTALLIFVGRKSVALYAIGVFIVVASLGIWLQCLCSIWCNWLVPALVQLPLAALVAVIAPRFPVVGFISYRRKGGDSFALTLLQALWLRDKEALLDVKDITSGTFPDQILRMIDRSPNFILVLSPKALDERMLQPEDWLRREITYALEKKKHIIPILVDGFDFASAQLPPGTENLPQLQSIVHHHDNWETTIRQLESYLRSKPKKQTARPTDRTSADARSTINVTHK